MNTLSGGGAMGAAMRAFDWSQTSLGPVADWPRSLKTVVRLMLDSRFAMWLAWGPELVFFCNDAYRPTLGSKRDFLGAPASSVWAEIWPDVAPRIERVMRHGEATWDENLLLFLERRGYKEETYHSFSYSPVHGDTGAVEGMLCVVSEETERRLAERRLMLLAALTNATSAARSVTHAATLVTETLAQAPSDLPFVLLYLIDEAGDATTLAGGQGIELGHVAGDVWPLAAVRASAHAQTVDDVIERIGAHTAAPWPEPVARAHVLPLARAGRPDELSGFLVCGLSPRLVFDDAYERFLALLAAQVAKAIDDARAFEEEQQRRDALIELDRAKTVFFANVSHELRTPLTLMLAPVEELLTSSDDERQRELLRLAQRNGSRLQRLVNTLLDFSRIEAGRVQASFEPVDLAAVTADLASVFRAAIERAGLRLDIRCEPLVEPVHVDRGMWEKIVFNLLGNAFKYTHQGGIEVRVHGDAHGATFAVRDTGIGIAPAVQAKVFERFYRVEGAEGRSLEGSGIGLALVSELARLHGASVALESEPGRGSTFSVRLRYGSAHLPTERLAAPTAPALPADAGEARAWFEKTQDWLSDTHPGALDAVPALEAASATSTTVLVADDNADMRAYLQRLLSRRYRVVSVADGREALRVACELQPDLVLSDVMMPGLDGFALLRALRAEPRTRLVPVVLLSARAGDEARLEGLQAGADDYLVKPFQARELLARVDGVMALARTRAALAERDAALNESEARSQQEVAASERRLAQMADAMPQIVYVNGTDGRIEFINRQWREFTGIDDAGPEALPRVVHPDDLPGLQERWQHAVASGRPLAAEFRLRRSDGEYRWFLTRAEPSFDDAGRVVRWYGTSTNIDLHKRHADALKTTHDALQRADRRKDEFLATLAHELRNPLAPLRNSLHLLQMQVEPDTAHRLHAMMKRQLDHLVRLVDDLLEVARISAGKIVLQRAPLPLAGVLASAVETARPLIDEAGHRLDVDVLTPEPLVVDGDAVRLAQVFANLLNNAAKYTERGGRIALVARRDGEEAVVSVRDSGVGIDADLLPRVFELFAQAESGAARAQGGLGIGLNLVRNLLAMHGGTVEARSEGPGRGSEFVVRLPLVAAAHEPAVGGASSDPVPPRQSPIKVLVCDDNRDAADSLGQLLELLGAHVTVVHEGPAALDAAERLQPQLVLLDLGMPQMDGYTVARRLRETAATRAAMLVAVSGWGQARDRERGAAAGFDEHLVKPIDLQALQRLMAATLAGENARRELSEGGPR